MLDPFSISACVDAFQVALIISLIVIYSIIILVGRKQRQKLSVADSLFTASPALPSSQHPHSTHLSAPLNRGLMPSSSASPFPPSPDFPADEDAAGAAGAHELPQVKHMLERYEKASFVVFGLCWLLNFIVVFSIWTWWIGLVNLLLNTFILYGLFTRKASVMGVYGCLSIVKAVFMLVAGLLVLWSSYRYPPWHSMTFYECNETKFNTFCIASLCTAGVVLSMAESMLGWLRFVTLNAAIYTMESAQQPTHVVIPHVVGYP